nr:hypothetical protein Itr_chr05CG00010 [Ipomoea trifida]
MTLRRSSRKGLRSNCGRSQSPGSSSENSEKIKIRCGNLELPVSPEVLDDLLERSKKEKGDMEEDQNGKTSVSSKAVKAEEAPMAPGISRDGNPKEWQQQGVMKPAEERDYYVREEKKGKFQ